MPPYISIIVPTMRAGGLNILLDSLAEQEFTDFEIVLSDGLKDRRADLVAKAAHDRFLRVVHVAPDHNPFPNCAFCAYSNAALKAATGEVALFVVDYSRLPPDLLARHAAFHRADATGRLGMMAPHRYIGLDVHPEFPRYAQGDVDNYVSDLGAGYLDDFMLSIGDALDQAAEPHVVDGGGTARHDADPKLRAPAGPIGADHFHAKNESVRLEHVRAIGGYDEDLDGAHAYQDSDFADRLSALRGVRWILDPQPVVEIANPRHVFPFARRARDHASNEAIWRRKKASGYTIPVKSSIRPKESPVLEFSSAAHGDDRLTIALVYGEFSSAIHGVFDLEGLYTRSGLTGSESSFFNLARTLAERGHRVVAFCNCAEPYEHPSGLVVLPMNYIQKLPLMAECQAVLAWNEPDYLKFAPPGALRVVDQQLNDWGYCRLPEWQTYVDHFVFPSESSQQNHAQYVQGQWKTVIPNSVDLGLFEKGHGPCGLTSEQVNDAMCSCGGRICTANLKRHPHRVVYCSSPDRGLHHLLAMWPDVRARVPDAELKIFYRVAPWLIRVRDLDEEVGRRARFIEEAFYRLDGMGVEVVDLVPNAQMARELQAATVLAYPCDPVRYTEGFGCSVLDAAAAGCVPVISEADALPSAHRAGTIVVKGRPADTRDKWVDVISSVLLLQGGAPRDWADRMRAHAEAHSREKITDKWERFLRNAITARRA